MSDDPRESSVTAASATDDAFKRRMESAYTDDYLRILGIEHYRQGFFTPDIAPDDLPTALDRHLEVLTAPLGLGPQHTVLELGCNMGATTVQLIRRHGCTVHAIDIVPGMVEGARDRVRAEGLSGWAFVVQMVIQRLQYPDATFDFVIGIEVVNHLPDKSACFREIARVLKPGGQIVLAEYLLRRRAPWLGKRLVQSVLESDRLEDSEQYQGYLAAAGFEAAQIFDHAEETVIATTRAFRSERYRNRVRAYWVVYFGVVFSLFMPALYHLWVKMFREGHARYVFLYGRRASPD